VGRQRGGFGGVDRERDLAQADAGDFGGVDEPLAFAGPDDDAVEDVFAGVVEDALDRADRDAVGGDDGDAAGEGLVADLVVVVGAQWYMPESPELPSMPGAPPFLGVSLPERTPMTAIRMATTARSTTGRMKMRGMAAG
jgi:hypothetical protein